MGFKLTFLTEGRAPTLPSDPAYPNGMDVEMAGKHKACVASLPYPAKACGVHIVECEECGCRVGLTAAGRPDDPRSVRISCKPKPGEPVPCMHPSCASQAAAKWQVGLRIWFMGQPREPGSGNIGMTTLAVCDDCRPLVKVAELLDEKTKPVIAYSFGQRGAPMPDLDAAELEFTEVVLGAPLDMNALLEQADAMAAPPGKRH